MLPTPQMSLAHMPLWGTLIRKPMSTVIDIHHNDDRFSWGLGGIGEHGHLKITLASDLNPEYSWCNVSCNLFIFSSSVTQHSCMNLQCRRSMCVTSPIR